MAEIVCERLRKVFSTGSSEEIALDSADVTIPDKEFVTIVGPSGCGKTTLLRLLSGLDMPTDGSIYFGDERVNDVPPQNRDISMVFQNITLFPFKTVKSNILYGVKYTDMDDAVAEQKATELATTLKIEDHLEKKPGQLSGGQQQRVALARALIREPDLFLLDEPMSDLDAQLKIEMRSELKKLHKKFPVTTVYVTHDQEEALTLSDKVIVLNDGEVMQMSSPTDVYENPENLFVSQFIGSPSINIFEMEVQGNSLVGDLFDLPLTDDVMDEFGEGAYVGIRPNAIDIAGSDEEAIFSGTIQMVEHYGKEIVLHVKAPDMDAIVRVNISAVGYDAGDEVDLTFDFEDVHVFDGDTQEAITNDFSTLVAQKSNSPSP